MKRIIYPNGRIEFIDNSDNVIKTKRINTNKDGTYIIFTDSKNLRHNNDGFAFGWIAGKFKGYKVWLNHGHLGRLDGHSIEYENGEKAWYYRGKLIKCETQEEFKRRIKLMILW